MKLALVSDIHANLPALEAVLADIERRESEATIYHIGDLVGYAPWPDECVGLLRSRGITGVAGNYDSTVAARYKHCGCRYEDAEQERLSHESYRWTLDAVSGETRAFLGALPFRLDVVPAGGHEGGMRVVLVHGTPTLNTVYWTEDRSDEFCLKMAGVANLSAGDVIAFGHTHRPWQREVSGIHFINTGSVGRPKDADWRAGYVLLDTERPGSAEFVRVDYDVERAAAGIIASGLPAAFADHLRSGGATPRAPAAPTRA